MPLKLAAIVPHPPIMLPSIGKEMDRDQIKKTIESMHFLGDEVQIKNIEKIIVTSPHTDWGFDVPLYFLTKNFKGAVETILIKETLPEKSFENGGLFYENEIENSPLNIALIASGDLSHRLKEDGPYGLHEDGVNFDKEIISVLEEKNYFKMLELNKLYPEAGECGLNSISFLIGSLEQRKELEEKNYNPQILSYENYFGVGYLVLKYLL